MSLIKICATCRFWDFQRQDERGQVGQCRRNEPTYSWSWHSCDEYERIELEEV